MLPIASLAIIPFMAGAVVPYTKGNVIKTVIVLLLLFIPIMYISTYTADVHTAAFANMGQFTAEIDSGLQLASWDVGGDPLGYIILNVFKLFGFSL